MIQRGAQLARMACTNDGLGITLQCCEEAGADAGRFVRSMDVHHPRAALTA